VSRSAAWPNRSARCRAPANRFRSSRRPSSFTPTHIFGIRSPTRAGAPFFFGPREVRLSPDDVTLGFSQFSFRPDAGFNQFCYVGRLQFNPAPGDGPPRYDLVDVFRLLNDAPEAQPWRLDPMNPGEVLFNPLTQSCGDLRGFSSDGKETYGIHFPAWSNHIDLFATDLESGKTRRLTRTEYIDPGAPSPDDKWFVGLDVHVSGRNLFVGAMDGLPPAIDMVDSAVAVVSETRNNRNRRFFQPMLLDRYGQRGSYRGQQINAGDDSPGGISDPNWNGRADPAWSRALAAETDETDAHLPALLHSRMIQPPSTLIV